MQKITLHAFKTSGSRKKRGRMREGGGIHSFLSYDAEMDEGVHTGQVMQSALAIISRDVVFLRLR